MEDKMESYESSSLLKFIIKKLVSVRSYQLSLKS